MPPAAELTCAGPTGKFVASAAFPFVGTNHSLVGTSNGRYVFLGDFRGNVTYGDARVIIGNGNTMDAAAVRFNPDGSRRTSAVRARTRSSTTFTIGTFSFNNPTGANPGIVAKLDGTTAVGSSRAARWERPSRRRDRERYGRGRRLRQDLLFPQARRSSEIEKLRSGGGAAERFDRGQRSSGSRLYWLQLAPDS